MSLVADAMQPSIVRGLLDITGRLEKGAIADILLSSNKLGYDFGINNDALVFDFRDASVLAMSAARDISRFSSAAFVSYRDVAETVAEADKLAWGLIKIYYAAFYAGHALIRMTGQSCSNLEGIHIAYLRKLASTLSLSLSGPLETGMYHLVFNQDQTGFACRKAAGRSGGAHEVFWKVFGEYINTLSETTLLGHLAPNEARDAALKLDDLSRLLRTNGSHSYNWLSNVTNQIQYQHARGVWPSVSFNKAKRAVYSRLCLDRYKEPMEIDLDDREEDEIKKFIVACAFIVSVGEAMIRRVAERAEDRSKSFARNPLQHCRA